MGMIFRKKNFKPSLVTYQTDRLCLQICNVHIILALML